MPVLARVRTVLDGMYVALINDVTEIPRAWSFEESAADVANSLLTHQERLTEEQYTDLLVKHGGCFDVFGAITNVPHLFTLQKSRKNLSTTSSRKSGNQRRSE